MCIITSYIIANADYIGQLYGVAPMEYVTQRDMGCFLAPYTFLLCESILYYYDPGNVDLCSSSILTNSIFSLNLSVALPSFCHLGNICMHHYNYYSIAMSVYS